MDPKQIKNRLAGHPLLGQIDPGVLDVVIRSSKLVHFRAKRTLLKEGDPPEQVYYLLDGAVRVYHREKDGNEVLVKLFRGPALFGEMEVIAERPFLEYVTTLERSDILLIPAKVFRKLVNTQKQLAIDLVRDLAARLCIATHNEKALAFCDVDTRLANLLLDYVAIAGEPAGNGVRISVRLTQESMAHDLGVSRKSLVRALGKLQKLKILKKHEGRYEILDADALESRGSGTILHYALK
jgi:CRP-like cAMP-binding protein